MDVPVRLYNTADVNMLTGGKVVIENGLRHLVTINITRPDLDTIYFDALGTRIDNATRDILGLDPYKDLKPLTHSENVKFNELLNLLVTFRKQLNRGFRNSKGLLNAHLTLLGFKKYWKQVSKLKNQNKMVDLIKQFDLNMSVALETSIYAHKMQPGIIALIRTKIQPYIDANIAQEAAKPVVHELTSAEVEEFNEIYETIMDVCVICWDIFKKDKVVRTEFSFTKVVKNMGNHLTRPIEPPTE